MNYNLEMYKQMEKIEKGTKLLLNACCAPCSSAVLEKLANYFEITIFFYNPNITNKEEYNKRINELKRFINEYHTKYEVSTIEGDYNPEVYYETIKGLEDLPEKSKRCYKCYELRLKETAKIAEENNFPFFTTTLSLSPHKNAKWINKIGKNLENEINSTFLYSDFKKEEGYKRSIELSKEFDLYRQDYCGCIYSKRK